MNSINVKRNIIGSTKLRISVQEMDAMDANNRISTNNSGDKQLSKFMEEEELKEFHFQNAIKFHSVIPIPDHKLQIINQDDYDKMYPANFQMPRFRIINECMLENIVDYDFDSEDEEWLQNESDKCNLTVDNFEKYMYFLEMNSENQVPTFDYMKKFFKTHDLQAIEKTYDYWLNKRLKMNGRKIIFNIKSENTRKIKRKAHDPYLAFRACREKIHLRKNRSKDYQNYIHMIKIRAAMVSHLKFYKTDLLREKAKQEILKFKLRNFEEQYLNQEYSCYYFEKGILDNNLKEIASDYEFELEEENVEQDVLSTSSENMDEDTDDSFEFIRKPDCQYYKFQTNQINPERKFNNSTIGKIRRRRGRGGRIILDREPQKPLTFFTTSPEFKDIKFQRKILLTRCDKKQIISDDDKVSTFRLSTQNSKITISNMDAIEVLIE